MTAGYGDPAAARHAVADHRRRGLVLPARVLGQSRHRPLCLHRLRPLSGRVRRRLVHRQGPLSRRRLGGGAAAAASTKTRCSATTCSKARWRAARWSPTSNWSRTSRPAMRSKPRASIAGRAATGSCCRFIFSPKSGVPALSRWKMIDNLRRSLTPIFWVMAAIAGWALLPFTQAAQWQALLILALFMAPTFDDHRRDRAASALRHHGSRPLRPRWCATSRSAPRWWRCASCSWRIRPG